MRIQPTSRILCFLSIMLTALLSGCGGGVSDAPDLASVSGKVTLDGQPLPNAQVIFLPENGRPAMAMTNSEGVYELTYTADAEGAALGKYEVQISTYQEADEDAEGAEAQGQKEKVPAKYNNNTELTAEVKAGENKIDFALDSEGEIIEGDPENEGDCT